VWSSLLFSPAQVCVESCPDVTEIGVRDNPVCLDEVEVSQYTDLESDPLAIRVSGGVMYGHYIHVHV
jgi:hypothetical protein